MAANSWPVLVAVLAAGCADAPVCPTEEEGAPRELQCTGLYQDWDMREIAESARPYTPALSFWSDGAHKQRWIALPEEPIDTSDPDEWRFPVGTRVWKEISLGERHLETRLLWKSAPDKWVRATYVWSADQSIATRNDDGMADVGGTGYSVPSRTECDQCHDGRKDHLLGYEAINLGSPALIPEDHTGRARDALLWLHVNCGTSCHNSNPTAAAYPTGLRLKLLAAQLAGPVADLDSARTTLSVAATGPHHQGTVRIVPGDPAESLLVRLAGSRAADQMPPIATHTVDAQGLSALQAWISALAAE